MAFDFTGLLLLGTIILVGVVGNLLFGRTRIPEVVFLIGIGLLIGPILKLVPSEFFSENISFFVTVALIMVLLDSGLNLDLYRTVRNAGYALGFTFAVLVCTVAVVALSMHHLFGWPVLHGVFLGLIGSSTTTITVTHLVEKLKVDADTRNLLVLESVVNDLTIIAGASILLAIVVPESAGGASIAQIIFNKLVVSVVVGALLGIGWVFLYAYHLHGNTLSYIFTLGIAFVTYWATEEYLGMSGAITIMVFSLVIGNHQAIIEKLKVRTKLFSGIKQDVTAMKKTDVEFTFLIRTFFFVLLGIIFDVGVLRSSLPIFGVKVPAALLWIALAVLAGEVIARYIASVVMSFFNPSFRKERMVRTTMVASGFTSTLVAFLSFEEGLAIPYLTEIVLLLVVLTTLTAIAGTMVQERRAADAPQ